MKWLTLSVMGILMALLCTLGGPAQADCGLVGHLLAGRGN